MADELTGRRGHLLGFLDVAYAAELATGSCWPTRPVGSRRCQRP